MLELPLKKTSQSHFLREIFQPADSKSLRLTSTAFEMQLSHGVWGSRFKRLTTVCAKTVSSLLKEST